MVLGYRIDRNGKVFARELGRGEREVSVQEAREILMDRPELALSLSNKG